MKDLQIFENTKLAGHEVMFSVQNGVWLNATKIAKEVEADLSNYWKSPETIKYMEVLQKVNSVESTELKIAIQGSKGGTYIHPDLVVHFARWISPEFAVACDKFVKEQLLKEAKIRENILQQEFEKKTIEIVKAVEAKYETKLLEAQKKSKYKYIMYDDGTTSINGCAERLGLNETDLMNVVTWKQWQGTKFKFTIQRYLKDEIKGIVGSEKERGLPTYYPDIIKRAYDQWIEAGKPIITEEEQIRADKIKFLTKELKRLTNER